MAPSATLAINELSSQLESEGRGPLEEGAFFLQKPFTPTGLAQKVRQVLDGRALFAQLRLRGVHLRAAEVVDIEALHDFVIAAAAANRVRVDDAWLDSVTSVSRYSHADPVVCRCA